MCRELEPDGVAQVNTAFCVASTLHCFEPDAELASQMGIQKCRRLKDDAVPTLFARSEARVSFPSDAGPSGTVSRNMASSLADASTSKKIRTAYEKRERSRVSQFIQVICCIEPSLLCRFFYRLFHSF